MRRLIFAIGVLLAVLATGHRSGLILAQGVIPPPDSTYLATWPTSIKPNDIAANPVDGTLAVVDAGHSSIEILRPGGTHRGSVEGFRDPRSAAFTSGGLLLVGEAGPGTVKGYDANGNVLLTLGAQHGEFLTPNDIAIHPAKDRAFVVDSAAHSVKAYRLSDGAFEFQFGTFGIGPGELSFPVSAAVNPALDEIFVGDSRNRRIAVFDADTGAFKRNIGSAGGDQGEISYLGALFVDGEQRLFVVEALGGFVQILDPDGGFVGQIGDHGNGPGLLRSPKSVQIDRYNRLLVTSFIDQKIEVWGLDVFQNPTDQDITISASAIPSRLNPGLPSFQVVFQVEGIDPGEIEAQQLRINGSVAPTPDSARIGPHLSVRFATSEVLATLPPDIQGAVILSLTGVTGDGLRFTSDLAVVIVPPVLESGAVEGSEP